MKELQTIEHNGKRIFVLDLANSTPADAIRIMREAQPLVAKNAPNTVLMLTDVTNAVYNKESAEELKAFAAKNTPFIRASAVVGSTGFRRVLLSAVQLITGREIRTFDDRPSAVSWLATF